MTGKSLRMATTRMKRSSLATGLVRKEAVAEVNVKGCWECKLVVWNAVAWAIGTSSSGTTIDPSSRKEDRGSSAVLTDDWWNYVEAWEVDDAEWQQPYTPQPVV